MAQTRRHFITRAAGFGLGFAGLHALMARTGGVASGVLPGLEGESPFGPLLPDPDNLLDLPKGFSYRVVSPMGEVMDDGLLVPGKPDGMAAFPGPDGLTILVRNHEVDYRDVKLGPFGADERLVNTIPADRIYDKGRDGRPAQGGTTTLVYDTKARTLKSHFLSLAGTVYNCAGGPTPWGSWLSCEETTIGKATGASEDHGYVFEVPATTEIGLAEPVPLRAMGRFRHEAVAFEPASGVIYMTEDVEDGLIYRFIPREHGSLRAGGRLQALAAADGSPLDTRNIETTGIVIGRKIPVRWIDLTDIDTPDDDLRLRGAKKGAAVFSRGEGMWYGLGAVYWCCTSGGRAERGQLFRYHPSAAEATRAESTEPGTLELFIEPNDGSILDKPDNITAAPWGDLIVAEDGSGENFLVGVTPLGRCYMLARNAHSNGELAGACFSPDGSTLFVNLQGQHMTLAITGPWRRDPGTP